jgi:AcrR family transcriptional regulator
MPKPRKVAPLPLPDARRRWLAAGLAALAEGGLEALRIEAIAARVDLTKGSFYHHFDNREAYVEALLECWEHESTQRIIELAEDAPSIGAKFDRIGALSDAVDHRLEIALRGLAQHDPGIAATVARVDRRRIDYLAGLSRAIGAGAEYARFLAELGYYSFVGAQALHRLPHPPAWHTRLRRLFAAGVQAQAAQAGTVKATQRKRA